ncbi:uncharacterized protein LOC143228564 [Tachypleus tridentatus]|uniref:uncharacterized protein LOC143228564 n=1 Tax=Tachypleus tridentatus TaxID=6853 RepID=UPI003FD227C1
MGKIRDLSHFDSGMIVGARYGGPSISEIADLLGFLRTSIEFIEDDTHTQKSSSEGQFCGRKHLVNERGQRRMARHVQDHRKTINTQITILYNSGMQKGISECIKRRALKQMDYSCRRPHRVTLLPAKNRKTSLQWARYQ